jgi:cytochrome c-type biogenesis protein CcsB
MSDYLLPLLGGALFCYAAAALTYLASFKRHTTLICRGSTLLFGAGLALTICLMGAAWFASGRPPFKTLYESLLLLVFCTSIMHLAIERFIRLPILGCGVSSLLTIAITYSAAHRDLETIYLPPALQSPWFVPHVVVYFSGYSALLLAAVAAGAYLAFPSGVLNVDNVDKGNAARPIGYKSLMHGLVVAGFILLTAGLVLGAVWAKEAWGNYWTWDPKENWALISWLSYTLYFHVRRLPGCGDRLSAWLVLGAFAVVIFTYLGINLLPTAESSVHVYQ